jgi:hypothetical protein
MPGSHPHEERMKAPPCDRPKKHIPLRSLHRIALISCGVQAARAGCDSIDGRLPYGLVPCNIAETDSESGKLCERHRVKNNYLLRGEMASRFTGT